MEIITSKDNRYIKAARALNSAKGRAEQNLLPVEGLRLAEEALAAGAEVGFALVTEALLENPRGAKLAEALENLHCPLLQVPEKLLAQVADTEHPQGVFLAVRRAAKPLPQQGRVFVVCDRLADPGNLGTIFRTALAAGVDGVLLTPGCAAWDSPKVVRASMGAVFRLPILAAAEEELLAYLREKGARVLLTAADGAERFDRIALNTPHAWVMGSEAVGCSEFWWQAADAKVFLPMAEGAESLNVAVAAGVLMYQSFIQE